MGRLRDNSIKNYVYCPQKSRIKNRNKPGNYTVNQYLQCLQDREALTAALTTEEMQAYLLKAQARLDPRWEIFSAQLQVIDNYEQNNLRKCLEWKLTEMGYAVEQERTLADANTKEEIKEIKL